MLILSYAWRGILPSQVLC